MDVARAGRLTAGSGRWHFGLGDPNAVGWITVAAYAVVAALAIRAVMIARAGRAQVIGVDAREASNQRTLTWLWTLVATTMIVLGINKQLDLQSLLIQTVRDRAYRQGWYDDRRKYQAEFIAVVMVLSLIAVFVLGYLLRRVLQRVWLVVLGLGMLVSFVIIRASSFHYVDKVLALGRIRINWIIELSGIGLIAFATVLWYRSERRVLAGFANGAEEPGNRGGDDSGRDDSGDDGSGDADLRSGARPAGVPTGPA